MNYEFVCARNCWSFHDERGFYFILEPELSAEPAPDMDAIREAHLPKDADRWKFLAPPNTAAGRFERSMELDYARWRDGESYDLDAIREASPAERAVIESILLRHGITDWRDVEALAKLGTPTAKGAIQIVWERGPARIRCAISRYAPELIPAAERVRSLVDILETASLDDGLSQAIDEAKDFHPQPVIDALLRGTLRRNSEAAVNFAALLLYLYGKADCAQDWNYRPLFIRFSTENRQEREAAFVELCQKIGVDPSEYL